MEFLAPPSIWGVRGADSVDSGESVSLGGDIALRKKRKKKRRKRKERKKRKRRKKKLIL